jgi:hypothetical protein
MSSPTFKAVSEELVVSYAPENYEFRMEVSSMLVRASLGGK